MATKKQKRQAAQERRARFLDEVISDGMAAQRRDRERREERARKAKLDAETKKRRESTTEAVARIMGVPVEALQKSA